MITESLKVYVIVVTYNGSKWIDQCFGSLVNSSIPLTVLAIDNASSDNTVLKIREDYPSVQLIETGENLGFGKANNIGFKKALEDNADYVFLLNQDAWVEKNCIQNLISISLLNTDYGILAPFQLSYDGHHVERYFNDYVIGQYSPGYISDLFIGNVKELYRASFIHAAAWLIPIKIVIEIGGFDPLFFHYGEDNDYVQRLQYKKYSIGFVPTALMYHYGTNDGLINPQQNEVHKINYSLLRYKNPEGTMPGNTIVFLKNFFDAMTSCILYRRLKKFTFEFKLFWKLLLQIGRISKSRKEQKREYAYLT